jgi:formamidopyrimidine-DNA glycosylase
MPELPEVQRAADLLKAAAVGRRLEHLRVLHPSLARRLPPARAALLEGRTLERVERRGKYQLLSFEGGLVLVVHFRMTGDWRIGRVGDPAEPATRAILELADGTAVTLHDSRALATLTLVEGESEALPALGPEPFAPSFTAEWLREMLATRRGTIKPVLLDQRVVAGLGNIYAAEALWRARIDPRAVARSLNAERRGRLVRAIRDVLTRAPGGRYWLPGREARWHVYDREGEACTRCGASIRRIVQAGRSTYFCPRCQR